MDIFQNVYFIDYMEYGRKCTKYSILVEISVLFHNNITLIVFYKNYNEIAPKKEGGRQKTIEGNGRVGKRDWKEEEEGSERERKGKGGQNFKVRHFSCISIL